MKITARVRADIVRVGALVRYESAYKPIAAHRKIAKALEHLTLTSAEFSNDPVRDTAIKQAIVLWLESWVIPPLQEAYDKTAPKSKGGAS